MKKKIRKQQVCKQQLRDQGIEIKELIKILKVWEQDQEVFYVEMFEITEDFNGITESLIVGFKENIESDEEFEKRKTRKLKAEEYAKKIRKQRYLELKKEFEKDEKPNKTN